MRRSIIGLVLLACALPALADDKADWKKLEGDWTPVGMELGGTKWNAEQFKGSKLTITEGKYSLLFGGQADKGDVKIDSAKKPKAMDITGTEGPNKGKTIPAIYDFEDGVLKICYALKGTDRPGEFKTTKENEFFLAVYKRDKK